MRQHLRLRSANPTLTAKTFSAMPYTSENKMTLEGTINKTTICLCLLLATALYSWHYPSKTWIMIGGIAGLILAITTVFKPLWASYTVPAYAMFEGLMLGSLSQIFETMYPGIVSQAIFLTFGILGALLFAYRSKIIKASENFKLGVFAATGGIFLIYALNFIISFFGSSIPLIHNSSTFGILFSLFVVVIASLNLVIDFDFIEQGAERGAPKYMEWYGAFGLMVTLIWLYIEILHLLSKLQSRR